ncbi:hypothetical protein BpHYR1_048563 [Brachionus plicatilis]|uniref:Uncharacterized protein n=1 Tax=Brachionus plicatilis TaxID=10195 RepID=A0A3M7RWU2_BRAPC|nr:hypothetical protein BpHYR1_048563 [Brachionus plicatilis]
MFTLVPLGPSIRTPSLDLLEHNQLPNEEPHDEPQVLTGRGNGNGSGAGAEHGEPQVLIGRGRGNGSGRDNGSGAAKEKLNDEPHGEHILFLF